MTLKLITDATVEPVTLAEARLWCRIDPDNTAEDAMLQMLITSARQRAEHLTGASFIAQTWERVIDAFPEVEIELGNPPVISITSIKYIDEAGTEQTLNPLAYVLDKDNHPGWALPAEGYEWPTTLDTANAVRVRFVAGFGTTAADVAAPLKQWLQMQVATGYKMREQFVTGVSLTELPSSYVDRLLDRYRNWGV
jgi:uncharacterized phiE125 gp8 family phage protein